MIAAKRTRVELRGVSPSGADASTTRAESRTRVRTPWRAHTLFESTAIDDEGTSRAYLVSFHGTFPVPASEGELSSWIEFVRDDPGCAMGTWNRFRGAPEWPTVRRALCLLKAVVHLHRPDAIPTEFRPTTSPSNAMYCLLADFAGADDSDPFAGWTVAKPDQKEGKKPVPSETTTGLEKWLRRQVNAASGPIKLQPLPPGFGNLASKNRLRLLEILRSDGEERFRGMAPVKRVEPNQTTIACGPEGLSLVKQPRVGGSRRKTSDSAVARTDRSPKGQVRESASSRPAKSPSSVFPIPPNASSECAPERAVAPICDAESVERLTKTRREAWLKIDALLFLFGASRDPSAGSSNSVKVLGWRAVPDESDEPEEAERRLTETLATRLEGDDANLAVANSWEEKLPGVRLRGRNGRVALKLWKKYVSACWQYRGALWLRAAFARSDLRRWSIRLSLNLTTARFFVAGCPDLGFVVSLADATDLVGFYHFLHWTPLSTESLEIHGVAVWNRWKELLDARSSPDAYDVARRFGVLVPVPAATPEPNLPGEFSNSRSVRLESRPNGLETSSGYWIYLDECRRHAVALLEGLEHRSPKAKKSTRTRNPKRSQPTSERASDLADFLRRVWDVSSDDLEERICSTDRAGPANVETSLVATSSVPEQVPFVLDDDALADLVRKWDESGTGFETLLRRCQTRDFAKEPDLRAIGAWRATSCDEQCDSIKMLCEFDFDRWIVDHEDAELWKRCWLSLSLVLPNPIWAEKLVEVGFDVSKALRLLPSIASPENVRWVDFERYEAEVERSRGEGAPDLTEEEFATVYQRWFDHLPLRGVDLSAVADDLPLPKTTTNRGLSKRALPSSPRSTSS